jgi:hypothetical protein
MDAVKRRCLKMWKGMKNRTKSRKEYARVELKMTKNEFMIWAGPRVANFMFLYPELTPSPDRIDPEGHYEISNLRIIDADHNRRISGFTCKALRLDRLDTVSERVEVFALVIDSTCRHANIPKDKLIEYLKDSI